MGRIDPAGIIIISRARLTSAPSQSCLLELPGSITPPAQYYRSISLSLYLSHFKASGPFVVRKFSQFCTSFQEINQIFFLYLNAFSNFHLKITSQSTNLAGIFRFLLKGFQICTNNHKHYLLLIQEVGGTISYYLRYYFNKNNTKYLM